MRRIFLRLEVVAVVTVASCLVSLSLAHKPARAQIELMAGPGGTLALSNDKEGSAVLSLGGMRPGDSVTDTVTLGNTGTVPGDLSLASSNLVDTPGAGGGALSDELDLRIRDVTVPGSPVTVYNNKIDALTPVALGTLAAGDSRVYEFRVFFPDAGPGAENAYQGSAVSVRFDWSAVNNGPDIDPPETTITSGPAALSASLSPTFAFTADEAGSTFECSLDGGAFGACTSPASYSGLADGPHIFGVRATDASANTDPTPDSASWTIDTTAPIVSLADPGSPLHGTVTLIPVANDGTGSGVASLIVQRAPSGTGTWTTIGTSWNTSGVGDGSYDLRARAADNVGNTANSPLRTVTVDNSHPSEPKKFSGAKKKSHFVLRWKPATDAGGSISAYLVYANGSVATTLAGSELSVDMGRYKTSDSRAFQVAAEDAVGNIGPKTRALVIVPSVAKLTVAKAAARLIGRGLRLGPVSYAYSKTVASGRVIRSGKLIAFKAAAIPVTVSRGRADNRSTPTGEETSGYTPESGAGGTTPGGGASLSPSPQPTGGSAAGGDTSTPAVESGEGGPSAVVPERFSSGGESSSRYRALLGLTLLGGAFAAAGTAVFRAARPRKARSSAGIETLVFWDERLLHVVSKSLRRVTGRL